MSQVLSQRWVESGDESVFQLLYEVYYGRILGFTTALTGQAAEGEDLAREVFLRLYQGRPRYQQEAMAHGRALLYTITRRLAYR